jgi:GntR family transcriptional regulator
MTIERSEPVYAQVANAIRADIRDGRYAPGTQLPSERELSERFKVSSTTVKTAMAGLRAEGLITSHQGRPAIVTEHVPLIRVSELVSTENGFYTMLARARRRPATITTVTRGPATDDAADALGIPAGSEVVIRHRVMRAEDSPPLCLATSYFPPWVVDAAPNLANPDISGQPTWLREAFGLTYSEDVVDARRATEDEAQALQVEPGSPVVYTKGVTRDQQERTLHFISIVTAEGRLPYHYRYGAIPGDTEQASQATDQAMD